MLSCSNYFGTEKCIWIFFLKIKIATVFHCSVSLFKYVPVITVEFIVNLKINICFWKQFGGLQDDKNIVFRFQNYVADGKMIFLLTKKIFIFGRNSWHGIRSNSSCEPFRAKMKYE